MAIRSASKLSSARAASSSSSSSSSSSVSSLGSAAGRPADEEMARHQERLDQLALDNWADQHARESAPAGRLVRKPVTLLGAAPVPSPLVPPAPVDGLVSNAEELVLRKDASAVNDLVRAVFARSGVPIAIVFSSHLGEGSEQTKLAVQAELGVEASGASSDDVLGINALSSRVLVERAQNFATVCGSTWGVGGADGWHSGLVLVLCAAQFLPSSWVVCDVALGTAWGDTQGRALLSRNIVRHVTHVQLPLAAAAAAAAAARSSDRVTKNARSATLAAVATEAVRALETELITPMLDGSLAGVLAGPPNATRKWLADGRARGDASAAADRDARAMFAGGQMLACNSWGAIDATRGWGAIPPVPLQGVRFYQFICDHGHTLTYDQQCQVETLVRYQYTFSRVPVVLLTVSQLVNRPRAGKAGTARADAHAYARKVFASWRIGYAEQNFGVLILVVLDAHGGNLEVAQEENAAVLIGGAAWDPSNLRELAEPVNELHDGLRNADPITDLTKISRNIASTVRSVARSVARIHERSAPAELIPEPRGVRKPKYSVMPYATGTPGEALDDSQKDNAHSLDESNALARSGTTMTSSEFDQSGTITQSSTSPLKLSGSLNQSGVLETSMASVDV